MKYATKLEIVFNLNTKLIDLAYIQFILVYQFFNILSLL